MHLTVPAFLSILIVASITSAFGGSSKNPSGPEIAATQVFIYCPEFGESSRCNAHALLEDGNRDVPVCTDCHRSHDIGDPRTSRFHFATPELCGSCHTNEDVMKKYGLSTGVVATAVSTDNDVQAVDWLNQHQVVFTRPYLSRGEPHDSSGLAILDVRTGAVQTIRTPEDVVFGESPRCTPDGAWITFVYAQSVYVVRPDGSGRRLLAAPPLRLYLDLPRWIEGGSRVLFMQGGSGRLYNQVVRFDGSGLQDWPWWVGTADAISPDGRQVVVYGLDRRGPDSLAAVLYLRDLNDAQGTTLRQLTSFHPNPEATMLGGRGNGVLQTALPERVSVGK